MRYKSPLTEAVLLRRPLPFMVEAVVDDCKEVLLRCPNISELSGCDILGSRIWFSNSVFQGYLHTWELVEVDGGALVSINKDFINELIIEGVLNRTIKELHGYDTSKIAIASKSGQTVDILLENEHEKCYINIEHVIKSSHKNIGLFPANERRGINCLEQLIKLKHQGHRAVLFCCVTHSGVESVSADSVLYPAYQNMLKQALDAGVEVIAYRSLLSLQQISIEASVPFLLSADQVL